MITQSASWTSSSFVNVRGCYRFEYKLRDETNDGAGNPDVRHSGNLNMLYADGHVKSIKATKRNPFIELGIGMNQVQWNGANEW